MTLEQEAAAYVAGYTNARPARLRIGTHVWTSPTPENHGEAETVNRDARQLVKEWGALQNRKLEEDLTRFDHFPSLTYPHCGATRTVMLVPASGPRVSPPQETRSWRSL
jgi:hypothetical protein